MYEVCVVLYVCIQVQTLGLVSAPAFSLASLASCCF